MLLESFVYLLELLKSRAPGSSIVTPCGPCLMARRRCLQSINWGDDSVRTCLWLWNSGSVLRQVYQSPDTSSQGRVARRRPQSWHWPPQVRVGQPWAQWVPVAISRERVIYEIFRRCFSKGEWITRWWETVAQDCIQSESYWIRVWERDRAKECPEASLLGWGRSFCTARGSLTQGSPG